MILYLIAKLMEERRRISETLEDAEGDVSFLLYKKEQLEEQMMRHTAMWLEGQLPDVPPDLLLPPEILEADQVEDFSLGR